MKCKKCKGNINKKVSFCPNCGTKIKKNQKLVFSLIAVILILVSSIFFAFKNSKNKQIENPKKEEMNISYTSNGIPKFISGTFSENEINNEMDALNSLNSLKEELQFTNLEEEFVLESEEKVGEFTYYRFNQVYKGIPVFNQNVIVGVKNSNVTSFSGYYIPNVNVDINPKVQKEEIEEFIKENLNQEINIVKNELMVWAKEEKNILVYVIEVITNEEAFEFVIDANTKELLSKTEKMDYASTYSYTGEGMDGVTYTINLEEFYDLSHLRNRYRFLDPKRNIAIADYRSTGVLFSLAVSALPGAMPIEVDITEGVLDYNEEFIKNAVTAMSHYEKIYDYYLNVLGRDSYDNKGSKIIINLGVTKRSFSSQSLNNAFWAPMTNQMYIGNYDGKSFAAALDVLAHEFTHGVISYTSKFTTTPKDKNCANETGALNEGYADIIGALIEGENWTIGETVILARDLSNPLSLNTPSVKGGDFYYPEGYLKNGVTLEEYLRSKGYKQVTDYDNGGVHQNANVVGHAAYLMYESGAFTSKEEMAKVWYHSLFLLSSYSNFEDCALTVLESAKNLGLSEGSIYKIKDAFIKTNMLEEKEFTLSGKVKNKEKSIQHAKIQIYPLETQELLNTLYSKEDGTYTIDLHPGTYKIKVTKTGYKTYEETIRIEKNQVINIELTSTAGQESTFSCKEKDCVNLTLYYLTEGENGTLAEKIMTESIEKGTILGAQHLIKATDIGLDIKLKTDGKTFTFNIGGMNIDFAWYYRGTEEKFDWDKPITKDTTIEMKLFDGIFDNDLLTGATNGEIDADTILDASDYFMKWFE